MCGVPGAGCAVRCDLRAARRGVGRIGLAPELSTRMFVPRDMRHVLASSLSTCCPRLLYPISASERDSNPHDLLVAGADLRHVVSVTFRHLQFRRHNKALGCMVERKSASPQLTRNSLRISLRIHQTAADLLSVEVEWVNSTSQLTKSACVWRPQHMTSLRFSRVLRAVC